MDDPETTVRTKFVSLSPVMDERLTRLWAGAEADALGDGGIAIVERATGLSRTTIRAGRDELRAGFLILKPVDDRVRSSIGVVLNGRHCWHLPSRGDCPVGPCS